MNYLTLQDMHRQMLIDDDFTEDDTYLTMIGEAVERMVNDHLDYDVNELIAANGSLPKTIKMAMLMMAAYLYNQRGDADNMEIPDAFFVLLKPYVRYPIA